MIDNIKSGNWQEGYQLRSENSFATELNISRGTLRKAIDRLIDKGLLIRIQGKGTYVTANKISYPFAQELISFAESMDFKRYNFTTKVIEKRVIQSSSLIQKSLSIEDNISVLYLKRVRFIENEPAIFFENWIPLQYCPTIEEEDFEKVSVFDAIEKHANSRISHGVRKFTAVSLTHEEAILLDLRENEPVLCITQYTFNEQKTPLEQSRVLLRTDKYEITSVLTR
ncbi:GntR family transcriptional regulator [Tetragenococcus muriaticus]|uniref:GntR family transcriptional regulator n=1 Tax=Tetragenococcus muriaticus TaxID=64642 RepID=UPI0004293AFE|nr:GntR family transcriptional regulator [Tetragenococcus muriaticus]GMA48008.1 transcriptional regulator [Tetragenococcus muriaticus]